MSYIELSLVKLLNFYGEDKMKFVLSDFVSNKNKDVEHFIHQNAIPFTKQRIAMTYLVFSDELSPQLVGFYTFANKFVTIPSSNISNSFKKRISKFTQFDNELNRYLISMPLIAQLGKNNSSNLTQSITGNRLLKYAYDKVESAQLIIGGKTTYIECPSIAKLYDFYSSNKFVRFNERIITDQQNLVQMIKYFNA